MPLVLLLCALFSVQATAPLVLRLRVFNGPDEVTPEVRVNVFKAGERQTPIAEARGRAVIETSVAPGIYDAQVIRERDGRVVSIRWAERLILMPYPDEAGLHLEVINFQNGFGALEVRTADGTTPDVALFAVGARQQEVARPLTGSNYALFVVPAGPYDLRVRRNGQPTWQPGIEVPADRTRLWIAP